MSRMKTSTVLVTLGVALLVFLATTLAFASEPFSAGGDRAAVQSGAIEQSEQRSVRRTVRCDRGHKLARALSRAKPGTTIRVRGHCSESVVVTTDDLTIVVCSRRNIGRQRCA